MHAQATDTDLMDPAPPRPTRPTIPMPPHPTPCQVFKLMVPHFRYTLDINSKARASLIPASGIIEECFSPGVSRTSAALMGMEP